MVEVALGVRRETCQGILSTPRVVNAGPVPLRFACRNARVQRVGREVFNSPADAIFAGPLETGSRAEVWNALPPAAVLRTHHRYRLDHLGVGKPVRW